MNFLAIEDLPDTTEATVNSIKELGHTVIEAASIEAAREVLNRERVHGVILDQQVPMKAGGPMASSEEMEQFTRDIARGGFAANPALQFVWVSAYFLTKRQEGMEGCIGAISKAGDTTREIHGLFAQAIAGYYDEQPVETMRDQVLIELRAAADLGVGGDGLATCNIPAWRPDEDFTIPTAQLPDWVGLALRVAGGRPIYAKARVNLRAESPFELELGELRKVPDAEVDESELWDD